MGVDLTQWIFWWEFNKAPYLRLKTHIHNPSVVTGSDGWFLGDGQKKMGKNSLKPSESQIREVVVPALLRALKTETNNDIVTGCLIALAKIGDPSVSESGESQLEPILRSFLGDSNQEIRETAAVALGILASPQSITTLESLVRDNSSGKRLVGANTEVDPRTRAFAAYGLGLIGSRVGSEADRTRVVQILSQVLESDDTRTRDLKVSCVIAMGLVALDTIEAPLTSVTEGKKGKDPVVPPRASRLAQLDFLMRFLSDDDEHYLVRAHCPTALARLLAAPGIPGARFEEMRERIAGEFLERIESGKAPEELLQSCILALGLIGTNDGSNPLDQRIRSALVAVPRNVSGMQARNFSMIALAQVGGSSGRSDPESGIDEVRKALTRQLADGKKAIQPWAGLASGVLVGKLAKGLYSSPTLSSLQAAVRSALEEERDPANVGAYALAAGIMGDPDAVPLLLERLGREKDDTALGYVAIALGLMNAQEAIEKLQQIVDDARYQPERLKQCAIALGLLGDKKVVARLTALLAESKSLATQASLSSALGIIGDRDSIEPLVAMLEDKDQKVTPRARSFAAVALGIVADRELLPWNSTIALDLNYRASTETLTGSGTGILDIL